MFIKNDSIRTAQISAERTKAQAEARVRAVSKARASSVSQVDNADSGYETMAYLELKKLCINKR